MISTHAGLAQSLMIKAQRRFLDEIGRRLGTPVIYLKAAWADPVLYGGRGERRGGDIDILVRRSCFAAFSRALQSAGFQRHSVRWLEATIRWEQHAIAHWPPAGQLGVDLHRSLANRPWFDLPPQECLARAVAYDSVDGPILSLSPEDQVLYAVVHYANHRFDLDQRHLGDIVRLLAVRFVDWAVIADRASRYGLGVPLALLVETLRGRGVAVPSLPKRPSPLFSLRLRYAHRWVRTVPDLRRTKPYARFHDRLFRLPLLSNRPTALPRFVVKFLVLRALDVTHEVVSSKVHAQRRSD